MHKNQLRICMISGDYPPIRGGISDYTKILFNNLKKQMGSGNVFLITSKEASKEDKNIINEIKKWNLRGILKIISLVKKIKPDIIHIQYPASQYGFKPSVNFLPFLLKINGCSGPIISTLHEFSNRSLLGKIRLVPNIIFSNKTLVVSQNYIEDILYFLWPLKNLLKKKFVYIPIGPNILPYKTKLEDIKKIKKQITINHQDAILCCFGSIRKGKGIEMLIDVFQEIISGPTTKNIRLIFIGQCKGEYCLGIKKIVLEKKLSQHIIFTNYISEEDTSKYLFASDICVLPFSDGVSTKRGSFLAPLFHNIPIITTQSSFTPPELINYKNIILTKPNDKKDLEMAIKKLIMDKELQIVIKKNSLCLKKYFSWENITKKIISVYYKYYEGYE